MENARNMEVYSDILREISRYAKNSGRNRRSEMYFKLCTEYGYRNTYNRDAIEKKINEVLEDQADNLGMQTFRVRFFSRYTYEETGIRLNMEESRVHKHCGMIFEAFMNHEICNEFGKLYNECKERRNIHGRNNYVK